MARDMSDKDILKMELEQLQKEVKNTREPVSKTAKEICEWVEAQAAEDPLIKGVPEDKNPFKEKVLDITEQLWDIDYHMVITHGKEELQSNGENFCITV
ncbi:hypothetical protein Q8A67_000445 [Cirrhinus molitorella]|uniref:Guanine nucleotide-binding protein subunit gamma n=1 Tax=Cirrhinus molitorella TaxID=172907 RepID=A0AA88Q9S6_9TELE|nr:hypothetical protein Q8A67_000445 [Cirrhinus molitorella]